MIIWLTEFIIHLGEEYDKNQILKRIKNQIRREIRRTVIIIEIRYEKGFCVVILILKTLKISIKNLYIE